MDTNFRPNHWTPALCFCWRLSAIIYTGWFFFWEPKQNDLLSVKITATRAPELCSPIWGAIHTRLVFTAGRPLGPTLSPASIYRIQIFRLHLDSSDANLKLSSPSSRWEAEVRKTVWPQQEASGASHIFRGLSLFSSVFYTCFSVFVEIHCRTLWGFPGSVDVVSSGKNCCYCFRCLSSVLSYVHIAHSSNHFQWKV